jgi:hypothetical protein
MTLTLNLFPLGDCNSRHIPKPISGLPKSSPSTSTCGAKSIHSHILHHFLFVYHASNSLNDGHTLTIQFLSIVSAAVQFSHDLRSNHHARSDFHTFTSGSGSWSWATKVPAVVNAIIHTKANDFSSHHSLYLGISGQVIYFYAIRIKHLQHTKKLYIPKIKDVMFLLNSKEYFFFHL